MNNSSFFETLQKDGRLEEDDISRWVKMSAMMAALEAIGKDGATVVLKFDGGRPESMYTVVVSGASLGDSFFRKDGSQVLSLLQEAVEFYGCKQSHP